MKLFITSLIFLFFTLICPNLYSKETQYDGAVIFKAETNMPGVTIEGSSKTFKVLQADLANDNSNLTMIEAEIDAETLKTGIEMRDHHMFEKVFLVLSGNEKPVLLKMKLEKPNCEKKNTKLNCKGNANFIFGKKSFSKPLELIFDDKLNTEVSFNVSLKELALEIPGYLGIELEDTVAITMKAMKK